MAPKRKASALESAANKKKELEEVLTPVDLTLKPAGGYINKQRVLVFASRGITTRYRHFLDDLRKLLPHHKKDVKDASTFFDFISFTPLLAVHTMDELKMTGNALMGSRPLLTFDAAFDETAHMQLIKAMFIQVWGTPKGHPKSKPFIDRVMSFYFADGKIWCRNFQLADEADTKKLEQAALHRGEELTNLIEIGPRFVMTPIRIFDGSFGGVTLYQNPHYVAPNETRKHAKFDKRDKYVARKLAEDSRASRNQINVHPEDQFADVFAGAASP
ncbi:hypothetical protein DYB32_004666 [Aphanomyces invadans]|uniref:Brix domain-containing protein n=1 Tax=Aphanomyces invadans TaxID=157072 RepID=A0A418AX07_9STRA|nr:hypothetical protein DYB32_004666 [Aphanomyces invadans]